jgi:hypothetical protein
VIYKLNLLNTIQMNFVFEGVPCSLSSLSYDLFIIKSEVAQCLQLHPWDEVSQNTKYLFILHKTRAQSKPVIMFPTNKVALFDDTFSKVLLWIPTAPETETGKDTASFQPVVLRVSCIQPGLIIWQRVSSPSDKLSDCHEETCRTKLVSWLNIEFKF